MREVRFCSTRWPARCQVVHPMPVGCDAKRALLNSWTYAVGVALLLAIPAVSVADTGAISEGDENIKQVVDHLRDSHRYGTR